MKIKNMKLKLETLVNPIERAIELANSVNNDTAVFFKFSVKEDENSEQFIDASFKALDCRMHNVTDSGLFASNVMKVYYHFMMNTWKTKADDITEKYNKGECSLKDYRAVKEIFNCYHTIDTAVYSDNLVTNAPLFEKVCAGVFSGYWTANTSPDKLVKVLDSFTKGEVKKDDVKKAVDEYLKNISEKQDTATVKRYWMRCNNALLDDIISRYYKGRKTTNSGKVKKTYDTKGDIIRSEIILAVIEMMQAKLRCSSFGFEFGDNKQESKQDNKQESKQDNKQESKDKAGKKTLKTLYRELCKKFHPDNKESGNESIMKEINDAYAQKDIQKMRELYNKYM